MHTEFWIEPKLADVFLHQGLDGFEPWMNRAMGEVISVARGREVRRVEVAGETYYVKRRRDERLSRLLALVLFGTRPISGPLREFRMLRAMADHGFRVMEAAAWGEARWLGIPRMGFLVVRSVPGNHLAQVYRDGSAAGRVRLMESLGKLTGRLHAHGFFDHLRLKDLIEDEDGQLTMIDRESRHPWPRRFSVKAAMTALARTARRTLRDGHRMGPATTKAFLKGYREGVADCWWVEGSELRRQVFKAYRSESARNPKRSQ